MGIIWEDHGLFKNLESAPSRAESSLATLAREAAQPLANYAKAHAPWTDRTGRARSGLAVDIRSNGTTQTIGLHYSVDYGIWLELRFHQKFAIIIKTLQLQGPMVMNRYSELFGKMFD